MHLKLNLVYWSSKRRPTHQAQVTTTPPTISTCNDTAIYDGGAGDDLFYGLATHSLLQGIGQYLTEAVGFDLSHANIQTQGGTDAALLYDSAGNDTLVSTGNQAELTYGGSGVINRASAFDAVFAYQSIGTDNETQTLPLSFNLTLVGKCLKD